MKILKVVIAVDAGRNLAVLVEAAVRNTILQLRGHRHLQGIHRAPPRCDGARGPLRPPAAGLRPRRRAWLPDQLVSGQGRAVQGVARDDEVRDGRGPGFGEALAHRSGRGVGQHIVRHGDVAGPRTAWRPRGRSCRGHGCRPPSLGLLIRLPDRITLGHVAIVRKDHHGGVVHGGVPSARH